MKSTSSAGPFGTENFFEEKMKKSVDETLRDGIFSRVVSNHG